MAEQDVLSRLVQARRREAEALKELSAIVREHVRFEACDVVPESGPLALITPRGLESAFALRLGTPHEAESPEDIVVGLVLTMNHTGRIYHVELYYRPATEAFELKVPTDEYDAEATFSEGTVRDALDLIGVSTRTNETLNMTVARTKTELIAATFEKLRHDLMEGSVKESGI